jgi:hypothetical protein
VTTAAALAAAGHVARADTPVDQALPMIAAILVAAAAASRPEVAIAVPALLAASIAIPDEATRLLVFGVAVAAAFVTALVAGPGSLKAGDAGMTIHALVLTVGALLILRWIPADGDHLLREMVLIVLACAIAFVGGRSPVAIAIGVLAAFFTPAIPLRTLILPFMIIPFH